MSKIHLVMPMGGAGSRFFKNGFVMPKPLIEINGKPFFYWATKSIANYAETKDITFVVLKEHISKFEIDKKIKEYFPDAKIFVIPKVLDGAVLTCMAGVEEMNDDLPIIFNDCDHAFLCSEFYSYSKVGDLAAYDAALLSFESSDPKYSFLEMDESGYVTRTVEKQAISNYAICGAYYFKNKSIFLESATKYLEKCQYSEYFVSGVYNIMADENMKIANFMCDTHLSFGTPDEYFAAVGNPLFGILDK